MSVLSVGKSLSCFAQPLSSSELKMSKKNLTQNGGDTGVSELGTFKLDHLQPVDLILSRNFQAFLTFILGPILITPEG